jgi:putative hydrolase of the HAD superfamily
MRAVILDLGGVVLNSPLQAIASYEADNRIPIGSINRHVGSAVGGGAWGAHERGEVDFAGFCDAFEAEMATSGLVVDAAVLMARIAAFATPRSAVLDQIDRLRIRGLKLAALTNSWESMPMSGLTSHFDVWVESWKEGLRKPDPELFRRTLDRLGVKADQSLFCDDLGPNLKAARTLGMETFKVESEPALVEFLAALPR